ncbi:hypothetical protein R1sor_000261 [Riccia sorocarpa]|uniref:SWIM-type domain-containing protein n=1 Tax=Riccia sorocarpa TaxID=122646 RepID=A0ABD3GWL0_9MARC
MEARIDERVCKAEKSVRGLSWKMSSSEAAMVHLEKSGEKSLVFTVGGRCYWLWRLQWRWNDIAGVAKGQLALRSSLGGSVARTLLGAPIVQSLLCKSSDHSSVRTLPAHPAVELIAATCKYEELSHFASVAIRDAAIEDRPVYQHWAVDCSEEFLTAVSTWEAHENPRELFKKWAEDVVRVEVETGSGLYWESRTWEHSVTRPDKFVATMRCVCRQDRVCVNRQNSLANPRTSEKRRSIQHFRCQGELHVTLDTATALCSVTCIHLEDHDRSSWRENKFPLEALEFLDKVAEAGMRTADVYRFIRMQDHIDPSKITRAQMNYWVVEIESWRLVYLLAKKVVGDVEISLKQLQKRGEFPTWWVKFRKRWVDLAERDPSDRGYYVTDVSD